MVHIYVHPAYIHPHILMSIPGSNGPGRAARSTRCSCSSSPRRLRPLSTPAASPVPVPLLACCFVTFSLFAAMARSICQKEQKGGKECSGRERMLSGWTQEFGYIAGCCQGDCKWKEHCVLYYLAKTGHELDRALCLIGRRW